MRDPLQSPAASAAAMRGGGLRVLAWGGSAALSLISIPLLVRHLGVPEFGRYVAVLAVVNIAALGSDLGITALALRDWGALDAGRRGARMKALMRLRLAIVTVAALGAVVFALIADWPGRQVGGTAIACAGIYGQVVADFAIVALSGSLRFGRVAAVETTRAALGTLLIAVLVIAGSGLTLFFAAYAVAALAAAAFAAVLAWPWLSALTGAAPEPARPIVAATAPYALASAVHVVYFRAAIVVTSLDAAARQAGLFATVFRIAEFAGAVGSAVAGALTPALARSERDDRERMRGEAFRLVRTATAAGLAAAVLLEVLAAPLMRVIGGHATHAAVPVMRIQAPALIATFASFAMGAILLVLRRYRELLAANVAALALVIALALILVPSHGAKGAAVAVLAGEWLIAACQLVFLRTALGKHPAPPLPSRA